MNLLDRYKILANPFSRTAATMFPDMLKAAPFKKGQRLSSDYERNFTMYNTLGVASWTVPLALAVTAIVNAKAKRDVDKARAKSESHLLAAGRPILTPTPATDVATNKNVKRLKGIEQDTKELKKKASSVVESAVPILALPASYWLASKLATKFISDKISRDLEAERKNLRRLQDAEDLERLKLLGMVQTVPNTQPGGLPKQAGDDSSPSIGLRWLPRSISGLFDRVKDATEGMSPTGAGKLFLWDGFLLPAVVGSALLAVGGSAYLGKRDRDTKKVELLTKKLLGENRMHDPSMLSIELPENVISAGNANQMHRIEGLPTASDPLVQSALENSKEKDALFA